MSIDMVKTVFTYLIALIIIVGTGVLLRFPPPGIAPETLLTFLGVQVGFVMAYVFQERATSSAQQNQPTVTATTGPPARTIVTPPDNGA
jgi:hypothetical protein